MLKNYFVTALRSLRRNTVFSVIHVLSLAIGLSAALVIFLIARHEFSYDRFLPDGHRVYRLAFDVQFNGHEGHMTGLPTPLPAALQQQLPGVELAVPVFLCEGETALPVSIPSVQGGVVTPIGTPPGIVCTTADYFTLVPYAWLAGNATVLRQPYTTVLTERRAQLYFPGVPLADIVGREIIYSDSIQTTVAGIVRDLQENSDFTAVEFISIATLSGTRREAWTLDSWDNWSQNSKAYLRLHAAQDADAVARLATTLVTQSNDRVNRGSSYTNTVRIQPLADVHFNALYAGSQRTASRPALYALLGVAGFLLLLGCVNFVNLSTAQATRRTKEIGIRKTVGGRRGQIVRQFLVETLSITTLAMIASLVLAPFLLRVFAGFIPLSATLFINTPTIVYAVLLTLAVSVLAGFYPALVLSGVRPALILRGRLGTGGMARTTQLRKVLTVSQFMIAQFFIIVALVVSRQVDFSLHQDLGYNQEAILNFTMPPRVTDERHASFINRLQALPGVERVSSGFIPPAYDRSLLTMLGRPGAREDNQLSVQLRFGDENYIPLYGIQLVAGRNIRNGQESPEVVINETCARALGYTDVEKAVGEEVVMAGDSHLTVVGVMKDFYQRSTHARIDPMMLKGERGSYIHIALQAKQSGGTAWAETIGRIEAEYKALFPQTTFSFAFFDESIAAFYREELQTAKMLNWATGLSILISCMGLLGLVIYTAEIRRKEIGIRKVLGASIAAIISSLSREFVLLVVLAFVLAVPVAWYATDRWLESFQYKAPIHIGLFLVSGALLLAVALVTLSFQTIRAAHSNPVDSLRSE